MKRNLYYRYVLRRENFVKQFFLNILNLFSSEARSVLEVFIRKNFGERHFRLSHVLVHAVELMALPFLFVYIYNTLTGADAPDETLYDLNEGAPVMASSVTASWMPGAGYILWYAFIVALIAIGIKHYLDKKTQPSVFDFAKFSLSSGELQPFMNKVPFFEKIDIRTRECFLEPAVFFVVGILLAIVGQYLGWLLMILSFFYCVAYIADYEWGDNFIMDQIDEIICNQTLEGIFMNGNDGAENKGVTWRGRRPNGENFRRQILDTMFEDDDVLIVQ